MSQLFSNNARSTLSAGISAADTALVIQTAHADLFPVANTGAAPVSPAADWFKVVLQDAAGDVEIVYVRTRTAGSGTMSNLLRGQEGTTARTFISGSVVGLRITAADMEGTVRAPELLQNSTPQWLTNATGTSALTGNLTPPITAYVPGQTFRFVWPHGTPSLGPLTLSINGLPPVSIRSTAARPMEAGDLPPWALVEVVFDGTVFLTTHAASASDVIGVARLLGFSSPANSISLIGRAGPEIGNLSNGAAALTLHRHGAFAANFGLDTDNILKIGGWSFGNVAHQIAHGGNSNPASINTGALGSGTADATTVLRGDRTFQPLPSQTQIQNSAPQWLTNVTGTSAITASANPPITAYVAGQTFRFMPAGENPGPATININGLGARNILREDHQGPAVLAYGDIPAGTPCEIIFDGTQFQLRHAATASRLIVHRITGVNLNSLHTPGVYNGNMVTNTPPGIATTDWVYVEVMRHVHSTSEAWILQRLTSMQGAALNRTWVRQAYGTGAWTAWSEQTSAASVDPSALPTAVLGSGTADANTFLRGDRTFQSIATSGGPVNNHWVRFANGFTIATGSIFCTASNNTDYAGWTIFSRAFNSVLSVVAGGTHTGTVDSRMLGQVHVASLTNTRLDITMRNNVNAIGDSANIGYTVYGWS